MPKRVPTALPYVLLLLITAGIFSHTIAYGFIRWDDQQLVSENPNLLPPTLKHLGQFWIHPYAELYTPLSYTAWSVVALFAWDNQTGLNPHWFHAFNLILHLICAAMVFSILKKLFEKLTQSPWPAFVGAMIFALHPLQVEPVVWISGMNNLLAGTFALLAIRLYLNPGRSWYALATVAFLLALLAKPIAVVVPPIALAIDLLILRRPWLASLNRAGFWVLLAIPEILVTKMAQPILAFDPPQLEFRPIVAIDAIGFYLQKILIPINLSIDYARTPKRIWETGAFHFNLPMMSLIAFVLLLCRNKVIWIIAGAAISIAALLPTLGLVPFGFQEFSTTADRYMYLAMLGPAVIATWALARWPHPAMTTIASFVLVLLAGLNIYQSNFWKDTSSLTLHALEIDPGSATANSIRGAELTGAGRPDLAIRCYRTALIRNPNESAWRLNLANALLATNHPDQARDEYLTCLHLNPVNRIKVLINLGNAYVMMHDYDDAELQINAALQIDPNDPQALQNMRALQRIRQ